MSAEKDLLFFNPSDQSSCRELTPAHGGQLGSKREPLVSDCISLPTKLRTLNVNLEADELNSSLSVLIWKTKMKSSQIAILWDTERTLICLKPLVCWRQGYLLRQNKTSPGETLWYFSFDNEKVLQERNLVRNEYLLFCCNNLYSNYSIIAETTKNSTSSWLRLTWN